jgi:GDP-4-dehydro-6-deoxy-D-mannose reductase
MTTRRVLVTGVSGFVGGHLVPRLAENGFTVTGLGSEPAVGPARAALGDDLIADLRDPAAVRAAVTAARPDAVVHLAAQSSAARSFADPTATFHVNTIGTWNLLEAVRDAAPHARVLCVGTGEAYGSQPSGSHVAEDEPFRPASPYALSKAAADAMAELAASQWGLAVVRTRSFGHTGPGQTPTFVVPAWAQQIAAIERGAAEPVLRVGNLDVVRDLTDVRDVVAAYVALLAHGLPGAAYNVCRGEGLRLADVARQLCALARTAIQVVVDPERVRPVDVQWLVGDPGRIARDTGWRAAIPFERTLADVLEEWRAAA